MHADDVIYREISSPLGSLTLVGRGNTLYGLYMQRHRHGPQRDGRWRHDPAALDSAVEQLAAYFAGELARFEVSLALEGTEFQQRVWAALRELEFGQTTTYAALARRIGAANAPRAVGAAIGRNPVSIIVPCHRVVGFDGRLTGFGGGLPRKRWLLVHEGALAEGADRVERRLPAAV